MTPQCHAPVSDEDLLDYWADAIAVTDAERLEEHLFSCGDCSARLEAMASLGTGLAVLVRRGRVSGIVSRSLLNRMQRDGVQVRQYVMSPANGCPVRRFLATICWWCRCAPIFPPWKRSPFPSPVRRMR